MHAYVPAGHTRCHFSGKAGNVGYKMVLRYYILTRTGNATRWELTYDTMGTNYDAMRTTSNAMGTA